VVRVGAQTKAAADCRRREQLFKQRYAANGSDAGGSDLFSREKSYSVTPRKLRRSRTREFLLCKSRQMFNQTADIARRQKQHGIVLA
jgi:hypothetical protein